MLNHVSVLHSFLMLNDSLLHGYTTFCLSIHLLMNIWVANAFWPIMNNVAMNTCVFVFVWTYTFISLAFIPRVELLGHMITVFNL